MNTLKTTFIQSDLYWQDIDANLAMFEEKIWEIKEPTDVIILPEMFNTGFSMNAKSLAEPMNFKTFRWMNQMARQKDAAVVGSYIVKESTKYYNRLYWVEPDGNFDFYDKRHLFRMSDEHLTYSEGKKRMVCNFRGWKIMPLVCYDLRFPVWSRNRYYRDLGELEYDLLIYVANWPAPRTEVWDTLLKARSMENQCFTIGVNRTGSDGMRIDYNGHSTVFDFKGQPLNEISNKPTIQTVELNLDELKSFRKKFPAYLDGDEFEVNVS
ncbi:MAG: amidohydrolase [Cyclobacteriaceae bacterium]|nr:amidohydrolase [Cyclobacteriaceae bacterium]